VLRSANVGTSAQTAEPFFINPVLDTVKVSLGEGTTSWQVVVRNLLPTQSLATRRYYACVFPSPTYEWMKDNTPTIGAPNDTTNVYGVIEGHVYTSDSTPVAGQYVYYLPGQYIHTRCFGVRTDSTGFYRIRIAMQNDLVLRLVDSLGNVLSPDMVEGLHIEPDSVQVVDLVITQLATAKSTRARVAASADISVFVMRKDASTGMEIALASHRPAGGQFHIQLFTLDGAMVTQHALANRGPGTYSVRFPRHSLPASRYIVCVRNGAYSMEIPLMVD